MAIFYCETSPLSRSHKRSAIAASAYRTGSRLKDVNGRIWNYENRQCVAHTEIVTPEGEIPVTDSQALWLMAEHSERRRDSRTARQFEIALPAELPLEANIELARQFSTMLVKKYGVVAEFSIHLPHSGHKGKDDKKEKDHQDNTSDSDKEDNGKDKDEKKQPDPRNIHAHVMVTTREYHDGKLCEKMLFEIEDKRLREFSLPTGRQQIAEYREAWAGMVNAMLTRYGLDDFIYAGKVNKQQQVLMNEKLRTEKELAEIEKELAELEAEEAAAEAEPTITTKTEPIEPMKPKVITTAEPLAPRPIMPERFSIPIRKDPPDPKKKRTAARRALLVLAQRWRERREMEQRRREQRLRLRARLAAERQKKKEQEEKKRALLSSQKAERWRPPTL